MNDVPIAETFHSIQGEGLWTGVPMHFVRLAGCPVGSAATKTWLTQLGAPSDVLPMLPTGARASCCRTYDDRYFICDTDFNKHKMMRLDDIFGETWEQHICLTGGEPLIHMGTDWFQALVYDAPRRCITLHFETSGTIYADNVFGYLTKYIWIACAPKHGYIPRAIVESDEVKLLIDHDFDPARVPKEALEHKNLILSPMNDISNPNMENVELTLKLLREFPNARISAQWHKFLGLR